MIWLFFFYLSSVNLGQCLLLDTDPEVYMTVPEIIQHWGYPAEIHNVTTTDGYILQLHRIPHGKNQTAGGTRPVAFLQHGLLCSSSNWITNVPELAFGYLLADAGFDVWLGNSRGNLYSTGHVSLSTASSEYWSFSWDEMAKYDLNASINYALQEANQPHLYYVGHSQGTTSMFAKLYLEPSFKSKIRQFHAFAPIASGLHMQGLLRLFAIAPTGLVVQLLGSSILLGEDPVEKLLFDLIKVPCQTPLDGTCEVVLSLLGGPSDQLNVSRIAVFLSDFPAGTSSQNLAHWGQMIRTGEYKMYNYGIIDNIRHYQQMYPPFYNLSAVAVPTWLWWSPKDWLATEADITGYLLPNFPKAYLKANNVLDDVAHMDFIWGDRSAEQIYKPVIEIMKSDAQ